ncbi:MAG: metallophosphoesterase [Clostridia bacterium]
MQKIFWTSDLHFEHRKVAINFRGFESAEEMGEHIVKVWNDTVSKNDIVYLLGDMSIDIQYTKLLPWIKRLNGKIYLIEGNHDRRKEVKKLVKEEVIETLGGLFYDKFIVNDAPVYIQACHYPIMYWRRMEHGSYHFHGHMHNTFQGIGRSVDVGWDKWGKPMETSELIKYCDENYEKTGQAPNTISENK